MEPKPFQTLRACAGIALPLHVFWSIYIFVSLTDIMYYVHPCFQSKNTKNVLWCMVWNVYVYGVL